MCQMVARSRDTHSKEGNGKKNGRLETREDEWRDILKACPWHSGVGGTVDSIVDLQTVRFLSSAGCLCKSLWTKVSPKYRTGDAFYWINAVKNIVNAFLDCWEGKKPPQIKFKVNKLLPVLSTGMARLSLCPCLKIGSLMPLARVRD